MGEKMDTNHNNYKLLLFVVFFVSACGLFSAVVIPNEDRLPTFSLPAGTYNSDQYVEISFIPEFITEGYGTYNDTYSIYYTTDGSDPDIESYSQMYNSRVKIYANPIPVTGHGIRMTIKAVALITSSGGNYPQPASIGYAGNITTVLTGIQEATYNIDYALGISASNKYFWGDWIQMDTGDTFNITDKLLRKNNAIPIVISASGSNSISFGSFIITKVSDNVASISNNKLLFRHGGSSRSFSVKLAGFTDGLMGSISQSRGIGMGNQPIGGRTATRTNPNNPSDTEITVSGTDGTLAFTDAVANSPQTITIDTTGTNTQPISVTVEPTFDGEFIGTIPIVETGYIFKVTSTTSDTTNGYLYGNNYNNYVLALNINNIGNANCLTSVYSITSTDPKLHFVAGNVSYENESGYTTTQPTDLTNGNFSTILPGNSKNLYFLIEYGLLDTEFVDVTIDISITDSGAVSRTWIDSAVIRFYRRPVVLNTTSVNFDNNTTATLKGFIIHPNGKSDRFTVAHNGITSVLIPWSSQPYGLVFSGAGASNEMKYSFAVGSEPASISGLYTIPEINSYEPNDSEVTATSISTPSTPVKSYLKMGDIDYYEVEVSSIVP
jgi:hypothetical protein